LVASTLAFPRLASASVDDNDFSSLPIHKVVVDNRFPVSSEFATAIQRFGFPTHEIHGDVSWLWYHDLHTQWRRGPAAIAGLTTKESLFCLDLLARDQGMRVAYSAAHPLTPGHYGWVDPVAKLIARFPLSGREAMPVVRYLPSAQPATPQLFSWVIAPRRRPL